MDVSFTNVLEGARQFFQGLPVPSTGGAAASADHNLATSTSTASSTSASHDHGTASPSPAAPPAPPAPPPLSLPSQSASGSSNSNSNSSSNATNDPETSRYPNSDVRPSSAETGGASSSNSFWSPSVEPYPPQPTRVEVPDTRPGDDGSSMEASSSSSNTITLTEMQPSSNRASASNFPPKQSSSLSSSSSLSKEHPQPTTTTSTDTSSPHLHQMQPPQQPTSPGPVYQQLNTVSRTSFSTAEILASSHQTSYQTANERQPPPNASVVAQRTQYYPRYHHPDITKSAPVPFSQNSIYQSASVPAVTSLGNVQPATRPTPMEQPHVSSVTGQGHGLEQRVPSSYGNPAAPTSAASIYGSPSTQSYRPLQHQPQNRSSSSSNPTDRPLHAERSHSSRVSSSPSCSSVNPCSPRHGGSLSHIPSPSSASSSSQNLPAHIPSSHLPSAAGNAAAHRTQQQQPQQSSTQMQHQQQLQQHQQQQQLSSRINASPHSIGASAYRMVVHGTPASSSSSSASSSSNQMPPPPALSGYHPVASPHDAPHHAAPSPHRQSPHVSTLHNPHASPHHAPSPHSSFQPHSPTYPPPPPPPATSTPHSYSLPITSQHYQPNTSYAGNLYALPPQSSYHSFQKNPQPQPPPPPHSQASYYPQSSRSQGQPYVQPMPIPGPAQSICSGTGNTNGPGYHQSKPVTYNGVDPKRSSMEVPYASYRSPLPSVQRTNTHNLPPIAAVSSYHSNRREPTASKAQPMQRPRGYQPGGPIKVAVVTNLTSSMATPQRVAEYPTTMPSMNHAIPVNGRTTTATNSSYSRYASQHGYPTYATTTAPSHQGSNSSSTTVTSIGVAARSSVPPVSTMHAYQTADASRTGSSYHHQPVRATDDYGYKEYSYQNSSTSTAQSSVASNIVTPSPQTNGVRKRESPLDLSVKTVKTSADSTAQDDIETATEKHVSSSTVISSRSNGSRSMLPPPVQTTPQPASYPTFDNRLSSNSGRGIQTTSGQIRASTPQTVCAPKVDFLPDFNSAPLRHHHGQSHENTFQRRSSAQQLYAPPPQSLSSQHPNNTAPLPHMSSFKKSSLPTAQVYDAVTATAPPPPVPSSSYLVTNESRSSRYPPPMVDPARMGHTGLPIHDYPAEAKYYMDSRNKFGQLPPPQRDRTPTKRSGDAIYAAAVPHKQPRLDDWFHKRLSTAKAMHEQQKRQEMNLSVPLPNGTLVAPNTYEQRSDNGYSSSESSRYQQAYCDKRSYAEPKVTHSSLSYSHPSVAKPVNVHSLPQQLNASQSAYSSYRQAQKMGPPPGGTSTGQPAEPPSNTGADKRVLSLLRNSLENKQQREEQMNSQQPILANHSQQSFQNKVVAPVEPKTNIGRHNLSPFTAASLLERNSNTPPHYKFHVPRAVDSITQEAPRSLYASRVNSSATLPGKEALLGPRGAENQIHRDKDDGLAAILAAKIRTKAELKQVGTGQFASKPTAVPAAQEPSTTPKETLDSSASTSGPQSSAGSPPKLTREKVACLPPRRRLFSRTEDENTPVAPTVPVQASAPAIASTVPARASGFRSSSETSVFDFRESDSEGEMPVLERQTLEEMRRDRKQLSKVQPPVPLNDAMCMGMTSSSDLVKIELRENEKITEVDNMWSSACDKFMEQLRTGDAMKKRGRKKKTSCTVTSKLDEAETDNDKEADSNTSSQIKPEDIKQELQDIELSSDVKEEFPETSKEDETLESKDIKVEVKEEEPDVSKDFDKNLSDDSDEVPLIRRTKKMKKEDSDCEDEIICRKRRVGRGSRIKLQSSSGSDSSSEESDASTEFGHGSSVADRLRARKRSSINGTESEGMKLRSRDTTPHKAKGEKESKSSSSKTSSGSKKSKPKPLFGDGSDFRPGWEEEVYVYKKSLRMPPRLITVSKPPRFHRLSTSLPDLDPDSPALSVSMDSTDVCLDRKKIVDSDLESNYSFSTTGLGPGSKIDDEEATSSTTISCPAKTTKCNKSEASSIVDVLAQKVGTSRKEQKKKQKEKAEKGSNKLLPKGSNEPELLPTPSLTPLLESTKLPKGKSPKKDLKSLKSSPIKVSDSFLLGYFRKETVNNFRDTFKNNHALPNEFSTLVLKSRTRTETRVLKKQATIREVFGEERPASAPPMQNHDDTSQDDDSQTETVDNTLSKARTLKQKVVSRLKSAGILRSHKAILNSKRHLLIAKRRKDLLKSLAEKKLQSLKTEAEDETAQEETNDAKETENNELDDETNESEVSNKKKHKLRTSRRKFRSGFDYVRKKKKPLKKDETLPKERKRQVLTRPNPECVADIQSEIRTWVIKKGVGETLLHRAARLGYTDVTAYCLEKLNNAPSPKDNAGYTPLHEACSKGHLEIAKLLLAYGANASESANGGIRPLHEAAENGATELVRLLLSYGADPLLATYSGQTPLMLAAETDAYSILEQHLDDIQGRTSTPWSFGGPSSIFDPEETGYNPVDNPPMDSPEPEVDEIEMEMSDVNLPVLFSLINDPDKWVLLQDLMTALKIKSRDALLRQVNPKAHAGPPTIAHRDVMRELKLQDFLEQSRCCHLLSGGERINVRASKVTLIKYNDKVRSLLNVEKVVISLR
ncbi:uncharacterized protein LOC143207871 [Lasioglossum baleicum]|uniref:uncharacterized protein LOC143207871 n=1 Tax=Lasioglossum baleicum TaxID=434251 RepID=UPI003FCD1C3F